MKKLFSFGSSTSGHGNKNAVSPFTDKQVNRHDSPGNGLNKYVGDKHMCDFQSPKGLPSNLREPVPDSKSSRGFRKSRSLSSKQNFGCELEQTFFSCSSNEKKSPYSSDSGGLQHQRSQLFRGQNLIPRKQHKVDKCKTSSTQNAHKRPSSATSLRNLCSGKASIKIVDQYFDAEDKQEDDVSTREINPSRNSTVNGTGGERLPPRAKHMSRSSPKAIVKENRSSQSFKEGQVKFHNYVSGDWQDNAFRYESPPRIGKNVSRLPSQSRPLPKSKLKDQFHDIPKSIDDICGRSVNKCSDLNLNADAQKDCMNNACERIDEHIQDYDDYYGLEKKDSFLQDICKRHRKDDLDMDFGRSLKQAEKRIMLLSEELEQYCYIQNGESDMSALMQRIRYLTEEKMSLAVEVSILLQSLITERSSVEKRLRNAKSEHELRTRTLQEERNELLSNLEKKSYDWSFKLKKYQLEEERLREQVRELAEQNVSLQSEVSFPESDSECRSYFTDLKQQLKNMTARIAEVCQENWNLQKNLCVIQEKCKAAEEDRDCIRRNFNIKDEECRELHESISKLLSVCSEQEKTIEGLRKGFNEEIGKKSIQENLDKDVTELQREHIGLASTDLVWRTEVESYRFEMRNHNDNINKLQNSIQQSLEELTGTRETLTKVTQERDLMVEEVEKCNEENMLLSSELKVLKKQIEAYEEDILIKEGQITILKDSIRNQSHDPFDNPHSARNCF